ncbi:response regulator [Leptospira sp. WS92.C1]
METAKILIVEDETLVAQDIKYRLIKMGYSTLYVSSNGEDAIQQAKKFQPDLILMDIILAQGMDGVEAVKQIREFLNTPIIYLTASSDTDTLTRAKETSPSGFILKPFQTRELQIAIELTLHKNETEKEILKKEKWLSATLKSIGEGVIASDNTDIVFFINPTAQKLTGWNESEALGKKLLEIIHIVDTSSKNNTKNEAIVEKNLRSDIPSNGILIGKNGNKTQVTVAAKSVMGSNGEQLGVVLMIRDLENSDS